MTVSQTIGHETMFLGVSVLLGVVLFIVYDILRIFRRIVPHGSIWVGVEDFIYWLICTGAVFVMLYQENDGMVRGFALGGLVIGMALYYVTFSRMVIKVNVVVLKGIIGGIKKVLKLLFGPFFKIQKKVAHFLVKRLKKVWIAVKMGLCKL